MSIHVAPLDDATKKRLMIAVSQRGQASGLEAASKMVTMLATGRMRVVGTRELKDLAAALAEKAKDIRTQADSEIAALEAATKL